MNEKQSMLSRRHFLVAGTLAAAGGVLGTGCDGTGSPSAPVARGVLPVGPSLPDLPYAFDALEPVIDARTMEIHHGRHHAAYANNLRASLEEHALLAEEPLAALLARIPVLPADIQTSVRNNGGGHWNHSLFWETMSPQGGGAPGGELAEALTDAFGDFAAFQQQFERAGATRFGSGWAWLVLTGDHRLVVSSTPNQDNPLMTGLVEVTGVPLLGLDVWEHAYYLHYQNRRGDYLSAWWDVVHWPRVEELYRSALNG